MASYVTDMIYDLSSQSGNAFLVTGRTENFFTVTKVGDPDATEFQVGDSVLFAGKHYSFQLLYRGHDSNGVFAQDGLGPMYYFSNEVYAPGQLLTLSPTPFPVCFVKGTLITTPNGPVAIEHLVPGDTVLGSTGWREVKWLGYRQYGPASFLSKESQTRITPVRIKAHAFADNVPDRDLLTSPWHHLLVDGKLVRAHDLINGITVVQESGISEVSYYHVELDQFDVIMAHGVYSESWADGGNRDFFQNVDVTTLRPGDMKRRRAPRPGFDHLILREGKELAAIQDRVAQRAEAILNSAATVQKAA
jgi:hypothetical protein